MVIFVESEKELHDFINLVKTEDVVAFPIFANQLDKRSSEITFIYFVSLKSNSKYVLNRTHLDASTFDLFKLLKTLTFTQKCYVEGLKWVFDIFRGDEIYDLQSVLYYTYNETESFKYLYSGVHIRDTLMLTDEAWAFSPILKTIESIDASLNPILNEISKFEITDSFKKYSKAHAYIFSELEKPGIQTLDGITYSNYNQYTATGRPANTNGKYNFLAMNKRTGVRKKIVSRHNRGRLFQFDYSAYHFRLIANLIGYNFPKNENLHEYIGKKILNKNKLTKKEYQNIKETNFGVLYGTKEPPDIEFFKKMYIYKQKLWNEFTTGDKVETIIFNRPILKSNHEDMKDNKLFNYIIQSYETERNLMVIYKLIDLLENKQTKLILYNYDGFVFDFNPNDGLDLLKDIREILEEGGYPTTTEFGLNYHDLEEYKDQVW